MTNTPNVVVKNMFTPSFKNLNHMYKTQGQVQKATMDMFDWKEIIMLLMCGRIEVPEKKDVE